VFANPFDESPICAFPLHAALSIPSADDSLSVKSAAIAGEVSISISKSLDHPSIKQSEPNGQAGENRQPHIFDRDGSVAKPENQDASESAKDRSDN
jgi:hypothetical protein